MRDLLSKEDTPEKSLRVKVIPGGCAGASYDMQFVLEPEVDDIIFHVSGFKMFIDKNSASLLQGLEIGYVNTMMESRFTFENPNASGSCGCGTSFDF
ncbi:hypothetical protein AB834_04650 [PVC group bacterium (ex Bugula neritina AB1)]|nr:hypothetical protein AB834_04650 [PVC group bacterium (ex Bugula neritina AB1)]